MNTKSHNKYGRRNIEMQENLLYTLKESNLLNTNFTAPAQVVVSCLRERSVPGVCIIYFCNIHSCWPPATSCSTPPMALFFNFFNNNKSLGFVLFNFEKILAVGWLGGHRGQSQTPFNKSIKSPAPPAANPHFWN